MSDPRLGLSELEAVLAVARRASFRQAAIDLDVSTTALSNTIAKLEATLETRLFNRTTRSVALTEAGERLYTRVSPAFRDIDDALEDLNSFRDKPSGTLRINAGLAAAQLALLPLVGRFLAAYPEVRIEVVADDALVDVVSAGFDAGVRFGERLEADMVSLALGPSMRSVVVGAPALFERYPEPHKPQDLHALPCIRHRFPSGAIYAWEFERGGIAQEITVDGPLTLDDVGLMVGPALQGVGLAYVFEDMVRDAITAGQLVQVLDDWCPYYPGLNLYYPSRRHLPAALRAFIEFIRAERDRR